MIFTDIFVDFEFSQKLSQIQENEHTPRSGHHPYTSGTSTASVLRRHSSSMDILKKSEPKSSSFYFFFKTHEVGIIDIFV